MFERYTEKARRAIFFARYEASQYGSKCIETEHLLLGLLREDYALAQKLLLEKGRAGAIREEVESQIKRGERTSTSIDMPLSEESKRILHKASEEASRLGHKHVGTEHLLLGIMGEENCLAARVLRGRGLELEWLREELHKLRNDTSRQAIGPERPAVEEIGSVAQLVEAWSEGKATKFARMFAGEGQFVDTSGNLWVGPERIEGAAELVFSAPGWVKTSGKIEDVQFVGSKAVVVTLAWEKSEQTGPPNPGCVRMTVILTQKPEGWSITRAQATGLQPQSRSAAR